MTADAMTRTRGGEAGDGRAMPPVVAFVALCAVLGAALLVAGFLRFTVLVAGLDTPGPETRADAIVVLTGGEERLADALGLLERGMGRRLLVSGVNPQTSRAALAGRQPGAAALFACCVDLDRDATDTIGNAAETAEWVAEQRFGSLVVVTSAYHVPRAMAELGRAMPGVDLVAWPVWTDSLPLGRWWQKPHTVKLLATEYAKHLVAGSRHLVPGGDALAVRFARAGG